MSDLPPSHADVESALKRIELGVATASDADTIRQHMGEMQEVIDYLFARLREERESVARLERALGEAFNSGSGAYIP